MEKEWLAEVANLEPEANPVFGTNPPVVVTYRARGRAFRSLIISDGVGLTFAALIGPLVASAVLGGSQHSLEHIGDVYVFNFAVIPMYVAVLSTHGLYRDVNRRISLNVFFDLPDIFHSLLVGNALYAIATYIANRDFNFRYVGAAEIIAMSLLALVSIPLARLASTLFGRRNLAGTVPILVVGTGRVAQTVAGHIRANSNVRFVGFVDDKPLGQNDVVGNLEDLPELCRIHHVSRVVVCFSRTHPEHLTDILKKLSGQVAISVVPRYYELITSRSVVEDFSGVTMLDIPAASMSGGARFIKRTFDFVASSLMLLLITPLFVGIAIVIKLTSSGPVLFRQERVGRNEENFLVLKFRTMSRGAEDTRHDLDHLNEADGPLFKMRADPRVTRLGRFLRRSSLDEVPQLINVWKGDMSLVGPRPFIVSESSLIEGWARKRFEARPGMTGLWQVSGRNELSHLELARLDYLYVASWSFWWDIYILWQTPAAVLRGRGAS
jgi:exopolysaccharide biosynthesis polyprenyl glycosylphosphotransferase